MIARAKKGSEATEKVISPMTITDIRIKLVEGEGRLLAYCLVTLDNQFVIHDFKLIQGEQRIFAAMPSRKVMGKCSKCEHKNPIGNHFCGKCGMRFDPNPNKPAKTHMDICHPIYPSCRAQFEEALIREYHAELERSREPGYQSRYSADYESDG